MTEDTKTYRPTRPSSSWARSVSEDPPAAITKPETS